MVLPTLLYEDVVEVAGRVDVHGAEIEAAQVKQRLSTHYPSAAGTAETGPLATARPLAQSAHAELDIDLDSRPPSRT